MTTNSTPEMYGRTNKTKAEMAALIKELVDQAPPLSDVQRAKLAELLRPVRISRDDVELAG